MENLEGSRPKARSRPATTPDGSTIFATAAASTQIAQSGSGRNVPAPMPGRIIALHFLRDAPMELAA